MHSHRSHSGFSLIEAAIVLALVGLVIGGIWAAASAVRTEMKVNQIMTGVLRGHELVHNLLTSSFLENNPATAESLTHDLLDNKLDGFGGRANDIWGGDYALGTPLGTGSYFHLDQYGPLNGHEVYTLTIGPVPKALCLRLTARYRTLMSGDPRGQIFAGLLSGDADNGGSYLGLYASPPYYALDEMRFDADSAVCGANNMLLNFAFAPASA